MYLFYLKTAFHNLGRDKILAGLIIAAIAFGIGASMTVFSIFHTMSEDPIPWKSFKLYVPRIDTRKPDDRKQYKDRLRTTLLSYQDASEFYRSPIPSAHSRQYTLGFHVLPPDSDRSPLHATGLAADRDFFSIFDVPFRFGFPWSKTEDESGNNVVVLSERLNRTLFAGRNSVGEHVNLDGTGYVIVGVLRDWNPQPRLYNIVNAPYGNSEDLFVPFSNAFNRHIEERGLDTCTGSFTAWFTEDCTWLTVWTEFSSPSDAERFRQFLTNYAAEQQRNGRFSWLPVTQLSSAREWLDENAGITSDMQLSLILAFGFLLVCTVNGVVLLLARFSSRERETGLRRAVGARRKDVFTQFLVEAGTIGAIAGFLGLALTMLGLAIERALLPQEMVRVAVISPSVVAMTLALAILTTVSAGIYPAWRGSVVQPVTQIK